MAEQPHEISNDTMTLDKKDEAPRQMDWLNGGLALIRAYTESVAAQYQFSDVRVSPAPYSGGNMNTQDVSLRISFNTESIKGCRNVRDAKVNAALESFQKDMVEINGYLHRHFYKDAEDVHYTLPLHKGSVTFTASKIKEKLAAGLPAESFIDYLKSKGLKR